MPENTIVKTLKMIYQEDFERSTSEMILNGYSMISAGYTVCGHEKQRGYWWAVLMMPLKKDESE